MTMWIATLLVSAHAQNIFVGECRSSLTFLQDFSIRMTHGVTEIDTELTMFNLQHQDGRSFVWIFMARPEQPGLLYGLASFSRLLHDAMADFSTIAPHAPRETTIGTGEFHREDSIMAQADAPFMYYDLTLTHARVLKKLGRDNQQTRFTCTVNEME